MFSILLKIVQAYTLIVFIHCLVSFASNAQNRWTVLLDKVCEPACKLGRAIAAKLFPTKRFPFDIGPLSGLLLMLLILLVINIIF